MPNVDIVLRLLDQTGGGLSRPLGDLGKLASRYLTVGAAVGGVTSIMRESIRSTVEYANQVRSLSAISGQSAESTSRFIQVLDDFKIGVEDVTVATRMLTKQGLAPNIATLEKLSAEYQTLNSAQERNEFLLKNLGRAGLEWHEVLSRAPGALQTMSEAVSDSLVLTQQAVDQSREYEIAVDNLSDAWMGFKTQVGTAILPLLTNLVNSSMDIAAAEKLAAEDGKNWYYLTILQQQAYRDQAAAAREAAKALITNAGAAQGAAAAGRGVVASQDEITQAGPSMYSVLNDLNTQFMEGKLTAQAYKSAVAALRAQIATLDGMEAWVNIYIMKHGSADVHVSTPTGGGGFADRPLGSMGGAQMGWRTGGRFLPMKRAALGALVEAGQPVIVGEFDQPEVFRRPGSNQTYLIPGDRGGEVVPLKTVQADKDEPRRDVMSLEAPALTTVFSATVEESSHITADAIRESNDQMREMMIDLVSRIPSALDIAKATAAEVAKISG